MTLVHRPLIDFSDHRPLPSINGKRLVEGYYIETKELEIGETYHGQAIHQSCIGITIIKERKDLRDREDDLYWQKYFLVALEHGDLSNWPRYRRLQEHLASLTKDQLNDFFKNAKVIKGPPTAQWLATVHLPKGGSNGAP